jgi:hypothetical protein
MLQGILRPSSEANTSPNSTYERRVLILWVLAAVAAFTFDFVLISAGGSAAQTLALPTLLVGMLVPAMSQWFVLRQYLPKLAWPRWLSATIIGSMLGAFGVTLSFLFLVWLAGLVFPNPSVSFSQLFGQRNSPLAGIILLWVAVVGGAVVAALYQWRTMAKYLSSEVLSLKSLWIRASGGAGIIGGFALLTPSGLFENGLGNTLIRFMLGVLVTAASSFVTGIVLARLLSAPMLPPENLSPDMAPPAGGFEQIYRVPRT